MASAVRSVQSEMEKAEQKRRQQWINIKANTILTSPRDEFTRQLLVIMDKIIDAKTSDCQIITKHRLTIQRDDIERLNWQPGKWLNDNVINFYMELTNERCKTKPNLAKVYAFNTYFATKLSAGTYNYENVRRWTQRQGIDVFSFQKVFIPVHSAEHWTLMTIHFDHKRIEYYDSLGGRKDELMYRVQSFLFDEHLQKKGTTFDETGWNFDIARGPQQENLIDCGVFICSYIDLTALEFPIFLKQHNIEMFRRKMMCEVGTGILQQQENHSDYVARRVRHARQIMENNR